CIRPPTGAVATSSSATGSGAGTRTPAGARTRSTSSPPTAETAGAGRVGQRAWPSCSISSTEEHITMREHADPSTWGIEWQIGTVPQDLVDAAIEATRGGSGRYRMLDLDEGDLPGEYNVRIPWVDRPTGIWGAWPGSSWSTRGTHPSACGPTCPTSSTRRP